MSSSLHTLLTRSIVLVAAAAFGAGTLICGPAVADSGVLTVVDPRVDHASSPILVEDAPVFSWRSESGVRGAVQSAYRVVVSDAGGVVWDSGKVESSSSIDVVYGGAELAAMSEYSWTVTVWDGQGHASDPVTSVFRTGLRSTDGVTNWGGAQWITQTAVEPERADDRFIALTFDLSATFTIIDGGAALAFAGVDDDYLAAAVRKVDGAWRLQLLDGDADGYSLFTRERAVPSGETWTDDQKFAPIDVALDGFDPAAEHTITVSEVGSDDSVFPSSSQWSISLDGTEVVAFELAGNRTLIRAGLLGLGLDGLDAAYTNIALTLPNSTAPNAINETTAALLADPASSIFSGLDAAIIADGWIRVTGKRIQEPDTSPSDGMFRKEFTAGSSIANATLYASALGVYEFELNGDKVGDSYLAPGTSDFYKTALYNAYDVTDMVVSGANTLGTILGDGWYSGSYGALHKPYGAQPSLKAMLLIEYEDGSTATIPTDSSWAYWANGPITDSNLMDGENYDARLEVPIEGWSTIGFDASDWESATVSSDSIGRVVADSGTAIRVVEKVAPISRTVDANGNIVFDFGKNMVGVPRITVAGEEGQTVQLSYGEMLNDDSAGADGPKGTIYNANFRSAKVTDYYTLGESGSGTFQPTFTIHGFRYLEVSGIDGFDPASVGIDDVTGIVLSSAEDITMSFQSSNEDFNALYRNTINGLRGNFVSIPTDTPARDERMGWLGDIQVFAPVATMTADVRNFLGKFTSIDMADSQLDDGHYPRFTPWHSGWDFGNGKSDPWTDAAIIVPHALWQTYGDTAIIEANYSQMRAYAQELHDGERGVILGDWLAFATTDTPFVFEAYKAHVIGLMEQMARAAGHADDADTYAAWRDEWKASFIEAYFPDGGATLVGENLDTQAAYSMVLEFGLYPEGQAEAISAHLAELSRSGANGESALTTGFLGTPVILPALLNNGKVQAAYDLVLSHAYPSWLYTVDQGATTFWERWNSYTLEDGFGDVSMNSFNHYAYGAVSKWIYNTVAGINLDPASPGYQHSILAPTLDPSGRVTWANATFASPYGDIVSNWKLDDAGALTYRVEVPANASATVKFPGLGDGDTVYEGGVVASAAEGVTLVGIEGGVATLEVGSGSYEFTTGSVPAPLLAVDPAHVRQGESTTITGTSFVPGAVVTLTAHSDPVVIADVTVDEAGGVSAVWSVPSDFPVGQHRVIASDEAGVELASASVVVVAADADVVPPGGGDAPSDGAGPGTLPGGGLSKTGASVVGVLVTALIVGAAGLALTRRRRAQS